MCPIHEPPLFKSGGSFAWGHPQATVSVRYHARQHG
jgi:hypothetical protein